MASADMCEHDWPGSGCKECFPPKEQDRDALEPVEVTQADREAAADLAGWLTVAEKEWDNRAPWFDAGFMDGAREGVWDQHEFVQAFARHRISHSLPGDALRIAKTLLLAIDGIEAHCRNDAGLKGEDHAADGRRVRHAMNLLAEEARQQIAALTPSALSDLQRLGQEYDGDALRGAAQAVVTEAERMTMTMRRRKIFDALARALSATPPAQKGEGDV